MAGYYLGIDLGTSSVRAFLVSFDPKSSYVDGENYDIQIPHPGYAEQDPLLWYEKLTAVVRRLLSTSGVDPDDIRAVSFSGQMHGMVALDAAGEPIMPVPTWLDARSEDAIREMYDILGEEMIHTHVQNRIATGFLLASLYWTKMHRKEDYERIAHVMLPKDYIRYRLCGRISTDYSDAAGSAAFDNSRFTWAWDVIRGLGLKEEIFPECLPSTQVVGHITEQAARDMGLSVKTQVVSGGSDQCMQSVGNAVITEGVCAAGIGTSSVISTPIPGAIYDRQLRTNTFAHVLPGKCCALVGCLNGGSALKWLSRKVIGVEDYNEISRMAGESGCGAHGLIFLPYLAGERTPHMNPKARGVFFGLNLDHDRKDLSRAVMEGIVFGMKDGMGVLKDMGLSCDRVVAAGGGARSDVWLQIQADILAVPITRSASKEQACLGAAITAAVGIGDFAGFDEACAQCVEPASQVFEPVKEHVALYEEIYEIYKDLYIANKPYFDTLVNIQQRLSN